MNVNKQEYWNMHVRTPAGSFKISLLYSHYIPEQRVFPLCCCSSLKSVCLPKMKPHSGLHAGLHTATYFHQGGKYLLLQLEAVLSMLFTILKTPTWEPNRIYRLMPKGLLGDAVKVSLIQVETGKIEATECLHLAEMDVFT